MFHYLACSSRHDSAILWTNQSTGFGPVCPLTVLAIIIIKPATALSVTQHLWLDCTYSFWYMYIHPPSPSNSFILCSIFQDITVYVPVANPCHQTQYSHYMSKVYFATTEKASAKKWPLSYTYSICIGMLRSNIIDSCFLLHTISYGFWEKLGSLNSRQEAGVACGCASSDSYSSSVPSKLANAV